MLLSERVVSAQAHQSLIETVRQTTDLKGQTVLLTNRYVELATGLNRRDPQTGQWVRARDTIETFDRGFVARESAHQVLWPKVLDATAVVDVLDAQGHRYRSRVLGLSWYDAGSRSASAAGLWDYTIRPDQLIEGHTPVDLGYHHIVWCQSGTEEFWTDQTPTPQQIAEWLMGPGFTVSNATYTGSPVARGIFGGGLSAGLPIETGLILATGSITNAEGPNDDTGVLTGPPDDGDQSSNLSQPGDADLDNLTGSNEQTFDAAMLEFDVTSSVDSDIRFTFFMGFEEYPEWIDYDPDKTFDDLMAIFITPASGTATNVAHVPGTTDVVSVATIFPGYQGVPPSHPEYYESNENPPTMNIQYDGLTTGGPMRVLLTEPVEMTPGITYHVKIAVEDARDPFYDSAVFLQGAVPCN